MDGSFQDLDGESMEVKVDEFFRESFKMLKFFQQKQNKAEQEREKIAGKPSKDEPKKQENSTIILCSTVMEQIKEFKVVLLLFQRHSLGLVVRCGVLCTDADVECACVNRTISL